MKRYWSALQQEGQAPYDHLRAFVDVQPHGHLRGRRDADYLADLLPWPLPLLEGLGIEAGKAEASVLAVVRPGDGYPDLPARPHHGAAPLAGRDQSFTPQAGERAPGGLPARVVLRGQLILRGHLGPGRELAGLDAFPQVIGYAPGRESLRWWHEPDDTSYFGVGTQVC